MRSAHRPLRDDAAAASAPPRHRRRPPASRFGPAGRARRLLASERERFLCGHCASAPCSSVPSAGVPFPSSTARSSRTSTPHATRYACVTRREPFTTRCGWSDGRPGFAWPRRVLRDEARDLRPSCATVAPCRRAPGRLRPVYAFSRRRDGDAPPRLAACGGRPVATAWRSVAPPPGLVVRRPSPASRAAITAGAAYFGRRCPLAPFVANCDRLAKFLTNMSATSWPARRRLLRRPGTTRLDSPPVLPYALRHLDPRPGLCARHATELAAHPAAPCAAVAQLMRLPVP